MEGGETTALKHIHCHMQNGEPVGIRRVMQGAQPRALGQPRGLGGVGGGREVQEGGDTCIPMAESR